MNAEQAWQTVLAQLQMDMPRASYDTWVRDTRPVGCENGVMTVRVRNAYARDWLDSRLAGTVNNLLLDTLDEDISVNFVVTQAEEIAAADLETIPVSMETPAPEIKPRHIALNPRYTFGTYVVGSGNRLAHAACQAVAEKPARAYNPLFLYGGVGLGKTHLLHAIGNACYANGLNVLYVSSEEFTNDLIAAIRTHTTQAFREKYRSADVLLIDDIQFIAGKESTQEEFFHTFNTLHGQDKQIIVSSDRSPKSLVTLEERLRSRFEWGLTADIQAPDLETRLAILRSKAERTGRVIPDEILNGIAQRVQSNIRELEGALNRILAYADLSGASLTPDLVEVALSDLMPSPADLEPAYVVDLVARKYGLTSEKLLGRDRTKDVALPRQIAMYLLREEAKISFPQIGEALGGRDHSTVMSAYDKIKEQLHSDRRLEQDIISIKQQLYNPSAAI